MGLQDLPLTHRKFSWDASNGGATQAQTRAACQALTAQGLCREVSYLVWNDLVDALGALQAALGESWEGSRENTAMSPADKTLTAARFNGWRQNLDKLWLLPWPWEETLGRRDMRGAAYWGEGADRVRGAYLLALAARLNRLIGALQGEGTAVLSHRGRLELLKQAAAQAARGQLLAHKTGEICTDWHGLSPAAGRLLLALGENYAPEQADIRAAPGSFQEHLRNLDSDEAAHGLMAAAVTGRESCAIKARGKERLLAAVVPQGASSSGFLARGQQALLEASADYAAATEKSRSTGDAGVFPLPADGILFVRGFGDSRSRNRGGMTEKGPALLAGRGGAGFRVSARLHNAVRAEGSIRQESATQVRGTLSLETYQGEWFDPVLTDGKLYIRSVYTQIRKDTALHLG